MYRRKTLLSAGPILMLIGAATPAAGTAEAEAGLQARSQTNAQADKPATRDEAVQAAFLSQPITLDVVDAPLSSALEAIARRAGVTLAYNADVLPADITVTLHASALPVREALTRALHGTGLAPTMTGSGHVMLARQPHLPPGRDVAARHEPQQAGVIGTVTDGRTGEPLRGAEVRVDESELSTVTDAEGGYAIENIPPGTRTLVASMIGYGEVRETVTVTAETTATVDFALTVSAVPLDEVVVTGTMVPTQMRAVPSPVSVITAEDIEQRGMARFEDVLRSIPGVGIGGLGGDDPRESFLYVRGANTLGANTIKTYIDGVEIANPVYSLNQIDPASIERIELVRGPQASTLYGSGAIAGVLQVFTKKGHLHEERLRVQATISAGSLESQHATGLTPVQDHSVMVTGGEEKVSFRVDASYRYTGEWVEDELIDQLGWDTDNSASTDFGVSSGLRYTAGRVKVEATARLHNNSAGLPVSDAVTDRARGGQWNYVGRTKPLGLETNLDAQTYGINVAIEATPSWTHSLSVGYDGTVVDFRRPQPRQTTPADTFLFYSSRAWTRRSITYRTSLKTYLGPNLSSTLQSGFDRSSFSQEEALTVNATQITGALGGSADLTLGDLANHGFFVQAQTAWRDQLFLTTGLRADKSSGFGDDLGYAWSPRVGLAHVIDVGRATIKARASYGTAIRPPQPEQKLGRIGGTFVTLPNEQLAAEAQTGYDTGLEFYLDNDISIGITRYEQDAEDLIAIVHLSDPSEVPVRQQFQNIGRIKNQGWEFEGSANIAGLTVRGHWSVLESTVEQLSPGYTGTAFTVGHRPLWAPRTTGELSITRATPRAMITIAMTHKGSWNGWRLLEYYEALFGTDPDREPYRGSVAAYTDTYPAIQRYALNGSYRITDQITALFAVDNLFNDNNPDWTDTGLVKGRQIVVGIRTDFGL